MRSTQTNGTGISGMSSSETTVKNATVQIEEHNTSCSFIFLINITKFYLKMSYSGPDSLPLKSESPQSPANSGSVSVMESLQSKSAQSPSNSSSVSVMESLQSKSAQSPSNSVTVLAVGAPGPHLPAIVAPFMMISDMYSCRFHACIYRHWKSSNLWQLSR